MDKNETILSIIKEKGPLLPVQVSKEIDDNILITSARLSELLTAKHIKISTIKVGGSPLYYSSGQESKLQSFVGNLNGMEKKAYDLLLQNKVLKDTSQEPAIRVALRQIKDFAVPLQVNYQDKSEIFWKWYLIDNRETEPIIKNILSKKEKTIQERLVENQETQRVPGTQKPKEEIKKDPTTNIKKTTNPHQFFKNIHNFFDENKINIIETQDVKKNSETDFIVELQTQIGNIKYSCKSKNKKKINEADLSSALIHAQSKNLPLLFLTNGMLTKKANEMLNNEFKNIIIKKIQ